MEGVYDFEIKRKRKKENSSQKFLLHVVENGLFLDYKLEMLFIRNWIIKEKYLNSDSCFHTLPEEIIHMILDFATYPRSYFYLDYMRKIKPFKKRLNIQ